MFYMVSYDWANDGSVGLSFRHVMVSGLRGELEQHATLGNRYEIQGQNCVKRLQGRVL